MRPLRAQRYPENTTSAAPNGSMAQLNGLKEARLDWQSRFKHNPDWGKESGVPAEAPYST